MENFIVAIPSYKRADKQVSLQYLVSLGIKKERIYIFVQTKEDFDKYQKYHEKANIIYIQASKVAKARNNILNYFNGKADILMIDDDLRQISKMNGKELKAIKTADEFDKTFEKCFEQTKKAGTTIFGIYPVHNAFFMSKTISTRVTVNTVFGFTKGFSFRFDENFDTKEDAEMCGHILELGGKILRFNFLSVDADHRKDKNGYFDKWHHDENVRCVKQLCHKHPSIFDKKKDQPWEVRVLIKDKKVMLNGK